MSSDIVLYDGLFPNIFLTSIFLLFNMYIILNKQTRYYTLCTISRYLKQCKSHAKTAYFAYFSSSMGISRFFFRCKTSICFFLIFLPFQRLFLPFLVYALKYISLFYFCRNTYIVIFLQNRLSNVLCHMKYK